MSDDFWDGYCEHGIGPEHVCWECRGPRLEKNVTSLETQIKILKTKMSGLTENMERMEKEHQEKVRQMVEAGDAMSLLIGSLRTNANPDGPSPAAGYVAAWEKTKGGK